ncbi:MAG: hypothetical protein DSO07_12695 [Thermoproteota archaeon]|jgi:hypothetical protein|nr:MAG: hypothetical protein DSO07_12695 [Candidatus Korarchaeota archaeon]
MKLNTDFFDIMYYQDLRDFPAKLRLFDKKGIPLIRFYATGEVVYNPTVIALFALGNLQLYLSGTGQRTIWEKAVNWLINNGIRTEVGFLLPLNFDHPLYYLKKGWLSAMTQGVAVSCFVRAFILTGNDLFLKIAYEASKPLMIEIRHGGVAYTDEDGIWLEEAPSPSSPSHILNGFIYGIMGLFDLFCISKDTHVEKILKEGILTLRKNIKRYDSGYWSLYQLNPALLAPLRYHMLHIQQLSFLYKITGESIFREYAIKFNNYAKSQKNYIMSRICGNMLYLNALFRMQGAHAFSYITRRIADIVANNLIK